MVRNSKRKAFTIVELVIVIAVIAILAAVMIPTFGGVIDSANLSADKQLLSTVNSQLSIYTGLGNKIETEADLWKALKGDFNGGSDLTAKFDPKSAKNGYHYWYDAAKQQAVLLQYDADDGLANVSTGKMMVVRAAETRDAVVFAPASPRSFVPGYYFLDTKCENTNDIADFFDLVADMSIKTKEDYQNAIRDLNAIGGDNEALASAVNTRMAETAIVTDKGAFINTTENKIKHIYIPENKTGNPDYYLSHTVIHATDAAVKDLASLATQVAGVIELPADIKVAEGSLNSYDNITIKVNTDSVDNLDDIFSAGSVSASATVQINTGASYTIEGAVVKQNGNVVATVTLSYRNPVTNFGVSATGDVATGTTTNYIALDKIKNGITLTMTAKDFVGATAGLPVYPDVKWSTETAGVSVDEKTGVVEFADNFSADTITFKAEAVAVNEGKVEKEITVTVVRITSATVDFLSGNNRGSQVIVLGGSDANNPYNPNKFLVDYEDASASAKFLPFSEFKYDEDKVCTNFKFNGSLSFTSDDINAMGISLPTLAITADGTYFTVSAPTADVSDHVIAFEHAKITDEINGLKGKIGTQAVSVVVSDKAGVAITAVINVNVNDNTTTPFKSAIPTYNNGHVYMVGKGNPIALNEFFAEKTGLTDLSDYNIFVYAETYTKTDGTTGKTIQADAKKEYYYFNADPVLSYTDKPTLTTALDFKNLETGIYHIVLLAPKPLEDGEIQIDGIQKADTITKIDIDVVEGTNITADSDVFKVITEEGSYKGQYNQTAYSTNVILHDNVELTAESDRAVIVLNANAKLYGNYFTIKAKSFKDSDSTTANPSGKNSAVANSGYSLITLSGDASEVNDLILDGPVYPEIATGSSTNGYYTFGINVVGKNCVINDSYLFGFQSPVRIQGSRVTTTIKGTTLEAGTWSNLWVNTAEKVTLEDVTTMQNSKGYDPDFGGTKKVLGMGVYIHDDMNGKSTTIELKGDTKQHNWIDINTNDTNFAGSIGLANTIVFAKENNAYIYDEFFHYAPTDTSKTTPYANAALAYQAVNFSSLEARVIAWISLARLLPDAYKTPPVKPTITVDDDANVIQYNQDMKPSTMTDLTLDKAGILLNMLPETISNIISGYGPNKVRADVDVWATSTVHDADDGCCEACLGHVVNGEYVVDFTYVPEVFKDFNPVTDYHE